MSRVSAKKKEQYVQERREKILDAAMVIFSSQGFAGTRMAEIATKAGLAKGTVYLYFKSKEEVFSTILAERTFVPKLVDLIDNSRPASVTLRRIAESYFDFMESNYALLRMTIADSNQFPERTQAIYREVILKACHALAGLFGSRGEMDNGASGDKPFLMSFCFLGLMMSYAFSQEILGGKNIVPVPREAWIDTMLQLFEVAGVDAEG